VKENVAVVRCPSYDDIVVQNAVQKVFLLTGVSENSFQKILFKPNMLSDRAPEEGVTTHPSVLEETVRYLKNSDSIIGDSPASVKKTASQYWEKCGYRLVSEVTGTPLVKFSSSFMVEVHLHPHPNLLPSRERETNTKRIEIPVTDYLKDHNVVNIAKLKTHGLTTITAAVKNLYGLIPGFHKSFLHSRFVSPYDFSGLLAAYYHTVKDYISFNIVDAVVSMEGDGPASGTLRYTGYLIGGRNAVAVDMVCCQLIGINPENIPYLKIHKMEYGLPEVEIVGDELIPVKDFNVPGRRAATIISSRIFRPFLKLLGRQFKAIPVIDFNLCQKCYACKQVCPVGAIGMDLKFNRKKCINCLCCFEVCPYKAIIVKKSLIARIFT
jgi:uncharacterized protein (DUF362 family)/Pyruvate/2-oxoacid:ferredoxin oxidoreductase delta subunit